MDERRPRARPGPRLSRPRIPGEPVDPVPVGEAIAAVGNELGYGDPRVLGRLVGAWAEIAGPAIAEHAHVRSLRRGVLTIAVDAAPWATQLRYLEAGLVARAGALLGDGVVREARVVVDPPPRDPEAERDAREAPAGEPRARVPARGDRARDGRNRGLRNPESGEVSGIMEEVRLEPRTPSDLRF